MPFSIDNIVSEFLVAADQIKDNGKESREIIMLYESLIDEELTELSRETPGTVEWVNESLDVVWVCAAKLLLHGLSVDTLLLSDLSSPLAEVEIIESIIISLSMHCVDFAGAFSELGRSNMSKCVEGKLVKNENGKVMKPDTYFKGNYKQYMRGE